MAAIEFNCPHCGALIAFDGKHAGKKAHCVSCGRHFIIPAESHLKPKKIETVLQKEKVEPIGGFYHAVFIESWKLFFRRDSAVPLVFVCAVVIFRLLLTGGCYCTDIVFYLIAWGWLFGFYLNTIYKTAFDNDGLPEIYLGTALNGIWYILKPLLVFFYTMLIVQIPFFISLALLQEKQITCENMWDDNSFYHLLLQWFFSMGVFLFPIAILTAAISGDITCLYRPYYLFRPILKAFLPYLVCAGLLFVTAIVEMQTELYPDKEIWATMGRLGVHLLVQVLAIVSMRSIGLFYRHYGCYFPW